MLAFIIFGTRGVRSTIKEGQFFCPQCLTDKNYKHKKVTQFFTLYFIPLIPLGNKGQYVECQTCRNTYLDRVLEIRPTFTVEDHIPVGSNSIQIEQTNPAITMAAVAASEQSNKPSKAEILSEKQKAIKKVLIMMILADGKVEDAEIHMFHKVYREVCNGLVADIYREIEQVQTENKLPHQYLKEVASFLNDEGKKDIIRASMMIAASDGDIDPSELRMVENFGKALELRPNEVREIIDAIKA